jgi:hypothetical protein
MASEKILKPPLDSCTMELLRALCPGSLLQASYRYSNSKAKYTYELRKQEIKGMPTARDKIGVLLESHSVTAIAETFSMEMLTDVLYIVTIPQIYAWVTGDTLPYLHRSVLGLGLGVALREGWYHGIEHLRRKKEAQIIPLEARLREQGTPVSVETFKKLYLPPSI